MSQFPYGVNRVNAGQAIHNPFGIPLPPGNVHGSPERSGSTRARSRGRAATQPPRRNEGTAGSTRPRTPRTPRQTIQEEVQNEDIEGRILVLENLAVTHATFLQQIHDDVHGMKRSISQMTAKVVSLDEYAQNIDKRMTEIRDGQDVAFRRAGQP